MELSAEDVQVEVFTFKEGLLSKVAHDLRLTCEKLAVQVEGDTVSATIDLTELRVACAQKDGRDDHGALSAGDKKKIRDSMLKEVLHTKRFGTASFEGTFEKGDETATIRGQLSLHGAKRSIEIPLKKSADRWSGEVSIHQPDYGIKPYTAMLGTLKVKADLKVRVGVKDPA